MAGAAGVGDDPYQFVDEVVVPVQQFGLLEFGLGLLFEVVDGLLLLLDDALLFLDFGLEVGPRDGLAALLLLGRVEVREVVVEGVVEPVEGVRRELLALAERDRRHVDALAAIWCAARGPAARSFRGLSLVGRGLLVLLTARGSFLPARSFRGLTSFVRAFEVHPRVEFAGADAFEEARALVVERAERLVAGVVDVLRLLHVGPRAELLGVEAAEVELGGERAHEVGVGLAHLRRERLVVEVDGVDPGAREAVLGASGDRPGLQPHRLQAVDDLAVLVEHRDVAVAEQFDDDGGVLVLAAELELQDAVEAVLAHLVEVRPGEAVAQHLREVRRPPGGVGDVLGCGDVGALRLADFEEEFDPPAVEVPHLQADEVVPVEVGLVDFRPLVVVEFGREGDEVDARQLPLLVHTPDSPGAALCLTVRSRRYRCPDRVRRGSRPDRASRPRLP